MMNKIELFLHDMSYNTKYEFLDYGKNKSEMDKIASKRGIKLPCKDLAIFKGTYGFVDRQNKNGCTLLKEEVSKALKTLNGKAVDFDHFRESVVGHWIDAKIEKDEIIAYGVFYKGNFPKDYELIQKLMKSNSLGISFEAWGDKEVTDEGNYNLNDIEFAGGALLIKEEPAFDGAGVLEMSNAKERVLEFAKVMTKPESFILGAKPEDKKIEDARFGTYDMEAIQKIVREAEKPKGEENSYIVIEKIDFKEEEVTVRYEPTNTIAVIDLKIKPKVKVTKRSKASLETIDKVYADKDVIVYTEENIVELFETSDKTGEDMEMALAEQVEYVDTKIEESKRINFKERQELKDNMFAVIKSITTKAGLKRKIRMFPIHEPSHVENAFDKLEEAKVKRILKKMGVSIDSVRNKILKRARQLNMKELLERYEGSDEAIKLKMFTELAQEGADLKTQIEAKDTEIATLKEEATNKDTELQAKVDELATVTTEKETVETEIARRDKEISDAKIADRREKLGDSAKDMSDEDILNDTKFENAQLKKENAELKDKLPEKATTDADLVKGSKDKKPGAEIFKAQRRVDEKAFGKIEKE